MSNAGQEPQFEIPDPSQATDRQMQGETRLAQRLRGFGLTGILAFVLILSGNLVFIPLSAVLELVWAHWSRTPWREIGYVKPKNWIATAAIGIAFGGALKLLMKAVIMPLFGAPEINQAFHYLAGNRAAIPATLWLLTAGAGFGEETIFRGYMFERLGKLLGRGVWARAATVLITSAIFASAHYSTQGLPGTEQAAVVGLVFGTIFAITGRIFVLMFAHAAFDLVAYALIYWNLETWVVHWVF